MCVTLLLVIQTLLCYTALSTHARIKTRRKIVSDYDDDCYGIGIILLLLNVLNNMEVSIEIPNVSNTLISSTDIILLYQVTIKTSC